ncbi:MAG TPA: hypothetical protein VHX87_09865 [Galbitalea sp.]|nr:hypothetical protein [Galbitalea sp.]
MPTARAKCEPYELQPWMSRVEIQDIERAIRPITSSDSVSVHGV